MRIYGVSRMMKERMLAGNDEIIKIMGKEKEEDYEQVRRKVG